MDHISHHNVFLRLSDYILDERNEPKCNNSAQGKTGKCVRIDHHKLIGNTILAVETVLYVCKTKSIEYSTHLIMYFLKIHNIIND